MKCQLLVVMFKTFLQTGEPPFSGRLWLFLRTFLRLCYAKILVRIDALVNFRLDGLLATCKGTATGGS